MNKIEIIPEATIQLEAADAEHRRLAAARNSAMGEAHALRQQLAAARKRDTEASNATTKAEVERLAKEFTTADEQAQVAIAAADAAQKTLNELRNPPAPNSGVNKNALVENRPPAPAPAPPPAPATPMPRDVEDVLMTLPDDPKTLSAKAKDAFKAATEFLFGKPKRVRTGWDAIMARVWESSGEGAKFHREIQKLAGYESRYKRLYAALCSLTDLNARDEWLKNRSKIADTILDAHDRHEGWTRKDYEEDYAERREAVKSAMSKLTQEYFPTAQKVGKEYITIARARADALDESDRGTHEHFAVPWTGPSALTTSIRKTADIVAQRTEKFHGFAAEPSVLVPFLDL